MKISGILKHRERGFALKFFPPKREDGREARMKVAHELYEFGPLYMEMTYGVGGTTRERTLTALGWLAEKRIPLMSHLIGIGATRDSIRP